MRCFLLLVNPGVLPCLIDYHFTFEIATLLVGAQGLILISNGLVILFAPAIVTATSAPLSGTYYKASLGWL